MTSVTRPLAPGLHRPGKVLAFLAVLMPVLCGMVGLVLDTGLYLAWRLQVQNAADSAAMEGALRLMRGSTEADAITKAKSFVTTYYGLASPDVEIKSSYTPLDGDAFDNLSQTRYVKVTASSSVTMAFLPALGISSSTVYARAVAGVVPLDQVYAGTTGYNGMVLLDSANITAQNGLVIGNNSTLTVNGAVTANSAGGGFDQYGQALSGSYPAVQANGSGEQLSATYVQANGASSTSSITKVNGSIPLATSATTVNDPMSGRLSSWWVAPAQWNLDSSVDWWTSKGAIAVDSANSSSSAPYVFSPGLYADIEIKANGYATFQPGAYVLSPSAANQGFRISGNATVNGSGVMFYLAASDWTSFWPGWYDYQDGQVNLSSGSLPSAPDPSYSTLKWANLKIDGDNANINLSGISDSSSYFDKILFFQRRRAQPSLASFSIKNSGGSAVLNLTGIAYAKWNLAELGSGTYNTQFVTGALKVKNDSTVSVTAPAAGTEPSWIKFNQAFNVGARQVFLVE